MTPVPATATTRLPSISTVPLIRPYAPPLSRTSCAPTRPSRARPGAAWIRGVIPPKVEQRPSESSLGPSTPDNPVAEPDPSAKGSGAATPRSRKSMRRRALRYRALHGRGAPRATCLQTRVTLHAREARRCFVPSTCIRRTSRRGRCPRDRRPKRRKRAYERRAQTAPSPRKGRARLRRWSARSGRDFQDFDSCSLHSTDRSLVRVKRISETWISPKEARTHFFENAPTPKILLAPRPLGTAWASGIRGRRRGKISR